MKFAFLCRCLQPRNFEIKQVPIPQVGPDEVLLKGIYLGCLTDSLTGLLSECLSVSVCGVCGTDAHIHDGEFISKFPVSDATV